jgi:hypothetical protein
MFCSRFNVFNILLLIFGAAAVHAVAADQAPASQDSKKAAAPSTSKPEAGKPAGGPQQAAPANGVVVFVDPATGQIRQPDPSEIGALVTPTNPAPKAPEPGLMQGPGGAVGAKLGPDAMTYMVVTTSPDGKLALDCVDGEKAANAKVTAPPAAKAKEPSQGSVPPHQDSKRPQDTQNVKIPR